MCRTKQVCLFITTLVLAGAAYATDAVCSKANACTHKAR